MKRPLSAMMLMLPSLAGAADFGVDATHYDGPAWSPYLVGAGIGVLSWLTFYFSDKPIGEVVPTATILPPASVASNRSHTCIPAFSASRIPTPTPPASKPAFTSGARRCWRSWANKNHQPHLPHGSQIHQQIPLG